MNYDVLVVGGGFAGVCSAIASAKMGAKTLIVEKGNCFGGAACNSLVNPFMPNKTKINGTVTELSQGIFDCIKQKLIERGAKKGNGFIEDELKLILQRMLIENGVDILLRSTLIGVKKQANAIKSAQFSTVGGMVSVSAKVFIDCTGDANLSFMAGANVRVGREDGLCQPMTMCFRVGGVDVEAFYKTKDELNELYKKFKKYYPYYQLG